MTIIKVNLTAHIGRRGAAFHLNFMYFTPIRDNFK